MDTNSRMNEIDILISNIKLARERQGSATIPFDVSHIVLNALRSQQARDEASPLTLEELKERDGRPVWITSNDSRGGIWALCKAPEYKDTVRCVAAYGTARESNDYGKTWLAYDKEVKTDELAALWGMDNNDS